MKLTKLQRHTAYILMLDECDLWDEKYWMGGFCRIIKDVFDFYVYEDKGSYDYIPLQDLLPELESFKPKISASCYWFGRDKDGWERRKKILQQCIQETY